MLRVADCTRPAGGEAGDGSSKMNQPYAHLDSRLPASGSAMGHFSVLSPAVSDALLWQPQGTHTDLSV